MTTFDVAVIGGGPAGYVAAIRLAQLGFKTVCIEKRKRLGGTCLNVGCIPSKTLLHSTELLAEFRDDGPDQGFLFGGIDVNMDKLMGRKEKVVDNLGKGIDGLFRKHKIERLFGHAKLTSTTTIDVDGQNVDAKHIILATGSEATPLPFLPFDEKRILSSTGALSLTAIPKKMVVVGAGVIGLELGSVYARLGTDVTFIEFLDRVCPTIDRDLSKSLQKTMERQGLKFHLSTKVASGEVTANGVSLKVDGSDQPIEADYVLVSIGRRPYTQDLGLESLGIEKDQMGRILVDGYFRTRHSNIYAVGDIIDGPMLAHKASEEGIAVAEIIAGITPHINYMAIPNVVYTNPEVATVGLSEEQAKAAGIDTKCGSFPYKANSRAQCTGATDGLVKIVSDGNTDRIIGMHIISDHASEMIGEGVVAIEKRVKVRELAAMSHSHPTHAEAIKEACLAVHKAQIHL